MKLLIIDTDSVGLALACWALDAGHEVKLMLRKQADGSEYKDGDGVAGLEKVTPTDVFWGRNLIRWADLIVPVGNGYYLDWFEPYRRNGYPIFGPSKASAQLEVDRFLGLKTLEQHGIECPPYIEFSNLEKAIQHIVENPRAWVFKSQGDEQDKSTSYVSSGAEDLIARLDRWKKQGKHFKQVMLQEKVDGIEMGVSRWFGPKGWVGPYNINFEHKKLMDGEKGPNTGEQGSVLKYTDSDKLGKTVLDPLTDCLLELGHVGDIDVNCIIDSKGRAWPLEFTMRLGWPAFNIQMACHLGDPLEWMCSILAGGEALQVDRRVACGVLLSQPDYPYSQWTLRETDGIPMWGVSDRMISTRRFAPQEMRKGEAPKIVKGRITRETAWVTAGDYLAVCTGLGSTIEAARTSAYRLIDMLDYPNKMYRTDIGVKVMKNIQKLHRLGYAGSMK